MPSPRIRQVISLNPSIMLTLRILTQQYWIQAHRLIPIYRLSLSTEIPGNSTTNSNRFKPLIQLTPTWARMSTEAERSMKMISTMYIFIRFPGKIHPSTNYNPIPSLENISRCIGIAGGGLHIYDMGICWSISSRVFRRRPRIYNIRRANVNHRRLLLVKNIGI